MFELNQPVGLYRFKPLLFVNIFINMHVKNLPPKILFTQEGLVKVKADFEKYSQKRKIDVVNLRTAREMGDLSENGAYKAARFELSDTDRQLRRLKYLLRFGEVQKKTAGNVIDFGTKVTLNDGKKHLEFTLVGGYESDPEQKKFSIHSPVGKAVLGKRVGDKIKVATPSGTHSYTIVRIE